MSLPNIVLNKSKCPWSVDGALHFSTVSDINQIIQVDADKPKQYN